MELRGWDIFWCFFPAFADLSMFLFRFRYTMFDTLWRMLFMNVF